MQKENLHIVAAKKKRSSNLFARNLRFIRKLRGISQQILAESVGLKRNQIASYESGMAEPKPEACLALARYFDISPVSLFLEDLSEHPARQLQKKPAAMALPELSDTLDDLVRITTDLQKIYDGFVEFHTLRKSYYLADQPDTQSFSNDFENLLEIAHSTLHVHWAFIQSLQQAPEQ